MPEQLKDLFSALAYAAEKHRWQRRAGYEPLPYINHLIKVSNILIQEGKEEDRDLLLASILHDIVEDTDVSPEELAQTFGQKVANTVVELTDDMSLDYAIRKQLQVENVKKLSDSAKKIRIADKIGNIRDIVDYPIDWPESKKKAYIKNAIEIVDQIRGIHPQLEACFNETVQYAKSKLNDV